MRSARARALAPACPGPARHEEQARTARSPNTAHTIVGNLAASLENLGDNVNSLMYWDGGHGDNEDAPEFITWIGKLTGYTA